MSVAVTDKIYAVPEVPRFVERTARYKKYRLVAVIVKGVFQRSVAAANHNGVTVTAGCFAVVGVVHLGIVAKHIGDCGKVQFVAVSAVAVYYYVVFHLPPPLVIV